MTELVLRINNKSDLNLILDLVKRLDISVQQITTLSDQDDKELSKDVIVKGVTSTSFGDAATYQRETRQDRKLPFRD